MELSSLNGNIIGVINYDIKESYNGLVKDIVIKKTEQALKMVGLTEEVLDKNFEDLSFRDKNKVILASKLQEKIIVLNNFSRGLTKKDIEFFKGLFKKVVKYDRKIILIDKNGELFINLVDNIYVFNNEEVLNFKSLYDNDLVKWIQLPKIVEFTQKTLENGVKINEYKELDELLKAIYRIKS